MWIFELVKPTILIFWTKFAPKKVFSVQNGKNEHHRWILLIQISIGTKFQLKLTILIFLSKFIQKGYFWSKTENITTEFCIFELVWVPNFSLDQQFSFFGSNLPKKGASGLKLKTHIFACVHGRISLFQFLILNPLSYCFKDMIGFDVKASFASRPVSRLIRWYNKPGDKTKELRKDYSVPR